METSSRVRVGIIGTSGIARDQHAPACATARNAQLHSVLSRTAESARDFASTFSGDETVKEFVDLNSFLADASLDAVVVASPDSMHFEQAKASLEAGKHTLVEKPLALTPQEGRLLIEIAQRQQCVLGVGFHLRWHPAIRTVLNLIRDGSIGRVRHITMRWTFQRSSLDDWRADPRFSRWWSLSGVGAHCIDLMWLFSAELGFTRSSLTASTVRNVLGSGNEETTAITATFNEGLTVQILSSVLFTSHSELTLFGEKGHISCEDVLGRANPGRIIANGRVVPYSFTNPYVRQIKGFCSAVVSNRAYPVSGEIGLNVLTDMDSIV